MNNKVDKNKVEYVIGIDFGHGETSAAMCPMQWDTPVEQLDRVTDLEMGGNKKVIPSAITIVDDETAFIGDSAFNPDKLKKASVHVCFKKAPTNIDGESEKIMIRFMKEVYHRIQKNNSALLTDGNHLVYIATPSGWSSATQKLYVEMAKKAKLPIAGVTKESRAAFVKAQQDTTSGISRNIDKGAIVFDMGSSTLDFTYMSKDLPKLIDNGYDCGASRVEKIIFAGKEKECEPIQLFEKKYPQLVDYLLFEARKVKEQVYSDPSSKVKKTINFEDFLDDEEFEEEKFRLIFEPGVLNEMLKQKGYIEEVSQAMNDFKQKHIPGQNIYGVFLTGGASRMDFIKDLVSECWKISKDKIYRDQDPSLTISQGVAEVARMDLRTAGMDEGLEEEINRLMGDNEIYEDFVEGFGSYLWAKVTDSVAGLINYFGSSDDDYSINDLKDAISGSVKETVEAEASHAGEFIEQAISKNLKEVQEKVDDIIRSYSSQGINTSYAVTTTTSQSQVININLDDMIEEVSQQLIDSSEDWSDNIAESIGVGVGVGVGTVLLAIVAPFGLIAVGLYRGLKWLFSEEKTEEEKREEAMSKELGLEDRSKIHDALADKWDEMCITISDSIDSSLRNDRQVKVSIDTSIRNMLANYKERLKSARVLID